MVVSPESVTVAEQQVVWLTATPLDSVGSPTDQPVTWVASDTTVATVSQDGLVTGVNVGQATITATSQGHSGAAAVTVTPEPGGTAVLRPADAPPRPKSKSAIH